MFLTYYFFLFLSAERVLISNNFQFLCFMKWNKRRRRDEEETSSIALENNKDRMKKILRIMKSIIEFQNNDKYQ